jgi:hypothetical protein
MICQNLRTDDARRDAGALDLEINAEIVGAGNAHPDFEQHNIDNEKHKGQLPKIRKRNRGWVPVSPMTMEGRHA